MTGHLEAGERGPATGWIGLRLLPAGLGPSDGAVAARLLADARELGVRYVAPGPGAEALLGAAEGFTVLRDEGGGVCTVDSLRVKIVTLSLLRPVPVDGPAVVVGALAGGVLSGSTRGREPIHAFLERLRPIAYARGKTLAQLAARWVLDQPGVVGLLWSARRPSQLAEALGALGFTLTEGELEGIARIRRETLGVM